MVSGKCSNGADLWVLCGLLCTAVCPVGSPDALKIRYVPELALDRVGGVVWVVHMAEFNANATDGCVIQSGHRPGWHLGGGRCF